MLHGRLPLLLNQDLLEQQRVDQGEADLDQMEGQDGQFLILWPIRQELSPATRENEAIDAVPLLNHIEGLLDFLTQSRVAEKFAQEDGLDHAAQLVEPLIGRVLQITARKPP